MRISIQFQWLRECGSRRTVFKTRLLGISIIIGHIRVFLENEILISPSIAMKKLNRES